MYTRVYVFMCVKEGKGHQAQKRNGPGRCSRGSGDRGRDEIFKV